MLKYLVIGIVILAVIFLVIRALGRRPKDVGGGHQQPKMITTDGGAVAAEIAGQELDINPAVLEEIRRLTEGGQKIEAIKLLREATGLSLKEAKDVVESLERLHPR